MNQIKINNMSVSYGNDPVMRDIDLAIPDGQFVAIVGRSGSGKSTFLHALGGFIPFSGSITVPKHLGMIFQHNALFPWMTVAENIAFNLHDLSTDKKKEAVMRHLELTGLTAKRDIYPAELSGGQIQRAALARSLAGQPELLLMDEPYSALDAYTRDQMQQWLLKVWEQNKTTVIFVTHDIEEAIFLADRILVMKDGCFIKDIAVPFARPRKEEQKFSPQFNTLRKEIFDLTSN